jgi:hypothetical protein
LLYQIQCDPDDIEMMAGPKTGISSFRIKPGIRKNPAGSVPGIPEQDYQNAGSARDEFPRLARGTP